jgi:hypothetical protein
MESSPGNPLTPQRRHAIFLKVVAEEEWAKASLRSTRRALHRLVRAVRLYAKHGGSPTRGMTAAARQAERALIRTAVQRRGQ